MDLGLVGQLNWLAVVAATVAYFALGGVWFIPRVFGDASTRSIGWEPSEEDTPGPAVYIGPLVTCFLASAAVALLARAAGASGVGEGVALGLVTGVGIAGAVLFVTGYFDPNKPQPMVWFAIMVSYHLLGLIIAAVRKSSTVVAPMVSPTSSSGRSSRLRNRTQDLPMSNRLPVDR